MSIQADKIVNQISIFYPGMFSEETPENGRKNGQKKKDAGYECPSFENGGHVSAFSGKEAGSYKGFPDAAQDTDGAEPESGLFPDGAGG